MNPSYYRISLDIHEATSQLSFSIKKGDTNRRLLISLTDNGVPYEITGDCYAIFSARKADKQIVFNDCTIQKNMIIYDITEQTSLVEGRLDCEITLNGEYGQQITSPRFTIIVYASVYTEEEVESSSEYKSLATLVSEGNAVINEGKELIETLDGITDSTLSVENKAADAKAVGDALAEVEQNLSEKHDNLDEKISANADSIDGKLDKIDTPTEMIITQKADGSTDRLAYSTGTVPYHMVRRDGNSQIQVVTPIERVHAANKGYVDDTMDTYVTPFIAHIYFAENLSEGKFDNGLLSAISYIASTTAVILYDKLTCDAAIVINANQLNSSFQYIYHNKMYYCQAGKDTVITDIESSGGLDVENVEITDGQIIVGGTASQKYNQAFITDEKVGVEDPYNVTSALLKLNDKRFDTGEDVGSTLRLDKSFLSGSNDYPYKYLKLPEKDGTLATLDDCGGKLYKRRITFTSSSTNQAFIFTDYVSSNPQYALSSRDFFETVIKQKIFWNTEYYDMSNGKQYYGQSSSADYGISFIGIGSSGLLDDPGFPMFDTPEMKAFATYVWGGDDFSTFIFDNYNVDYTEV